LDNQIKVVSASSYGEESLASIFNSSFEDYFIPVNFDEKKFRKRNEETGLSPNSSFVLEIDSKPAGICMLAELQRKAWCGGFGIYKEFRQLGCGNILLKESLDYLKSRRIESVSLEVLKENRKAFNLYKKFGFVENDEVYVLEKIFPKAAKKVEGSVEETDILTATKDYYHTIKNTFRVWECSAEIISRNKTLRTFSVKNNTEFQGYFSYKEDKDSVIVRDINFRKESAIPFLNLFGYYFSGRKVLFYFAHKKEEYWNILLSNEYKDIIGQYALQLSF